MRCSGLVKAFTSSQKTQSHLNVKSWDAQDFDEGKRGDRVFWILYQNCCGIIWFVNLVQDINGWFDWCLGEGGYILKYMYIPTEIKWKLVMFILDFAWEKNSKFLINNLRIHSCGEIILNFSHIEGITRFLEKLVAWVRRGWWQCWWKKAARVCGTYLARRRLAGTGAREKLRWSWIKINSDKGFTKVNRMTEYIWVLI